MGNLELQHLKDRLGNDEYQADTRSVPEKDLRLHCHKYARGLDGRLNQQTQLKRYDFTSSCAAPALDHVLEYDTTYYHSLSKAMSKDISPSRDFQSLCHGSRSRWVGQDQFQAQLQRYGFTTSQPTPSLDYDFENVTIPEPAREWSICYADNEFPTILHACSESRAVAMREGYALSFATPPFPAKIWFNPYADYLDIWSGTAEEYPDETGLLCEDLKRARKLLIDIYSYPEGLSRIVQEFKNVEELIIMLQKEDQKYLEPALQEHLQDLRIVDATEAEILRGYLLYTNPPDDTFHYFQDDYNNVLGPEILEYERNHPHGPPFLEYRAREIEQWLFGTRNESPYPGERPRKAPLVRFAFLTGEKGERLLNRIRQQYWMERELLPPPDVAAAILTEELDRLCTQRLPSPFDVQWVDDLEVEQEDHMRELYRTA